MQNSFMCLKRRNGESEENFQAVFEGEDAEVLCRDIDDSMNGNIGKPRTVEFLLKGLTPMSLTFYQLMLQREDL